MALQYFVSQMDSMEHPTTNIILNWRLQENFHSVSFYRFSPENPDILTTLGILYIEVDYYTIAQYIDNV